MPIQKITKPEILRIALSLFHKQGYYSTSMSDLAEACGLKKGSFYHYFSSKEALMEAVLEHLREYYQNKIFIQLQNKDLPFEERMKNICQIQKTALGHIHGGCFFGNMALETAHLAIQLKDNLKSFFQDWEQCLITFLCEKYELPQATLYAKKAIMLVEGAAMMARLYEDDAYLDIAFEELQRY